MPSNYIVESEGKQYAATPFGWIEVQPVHDDGSGVLEGMYKSMNGKVTIVLTDLGMAIIDNPAALRATF